jgi:methanogenic corrinoid protein MtbC1
MASMFEVDPATPHSGAGAGRSQSSQSDSHAADAQAFEWHSGHRNDANHDLHSRAHAGRMQEEMLCGGTDHSPLALARLIEGEIIPRLLMAHRGEPMLQTAYTPALPAEIAGSVTNAERDLFIPLVLTQEVHALLANIDVLLGRGVSIDAILLDLLAPAARTLGEYWEDDRCDFVDVTMGLWRLQHIVHELGQRAPHKTVSAHPDRRAHFTVAPGDQHSFGVVMIEDFFRRAGWQTSSAPTSTLAEVVALVSREWFELIGLTVSYEAHIDTLPDIIAALRNKSKNPALLVMVGGRIFTEQPGLAARVGADGTAPDGKQAVLSAEKLLGQLVNPTTADPSRARR